MANTEEKNTLVKYVQYVQHDFIEIVNLEKEACICLQEETIEYS